jgi:flagellar biogenesis protein FliO
MEFSDYTRFVLAFGFVIGLIWAVSYVAKRMGWDKKIRGVTGAQGRLAVVDVMYLDPKRKLTLIRADNREYLLLLSGDNAQVVDKFEVKS